MPLWGKPPVIRTVTRAACPCGCEVVNRVMLAHHIGGDSQSVTTQLAGETVRCCSCGTLFTVLSNGTTIVPKRLAPETKRQMENPGRGYGSLDDDIAQFEERLPGV